jgi:hypothetical protein
MDSSDSVLEPVEGFCEHGNEPQGSVKYGEFRKKIPRLSRP